MKNNYSAINGELAFVRTTHSACLSHCLSYVSWGLVIFQNSFELRSRQDTSETERFGHPMLKGTLGQPCRDLSLGDPASVRRVLDHKREFVDLAQQKRRNRLTLKRQSTDHGNSDGRISQQDIVTTNELSLPTKVVIQDQ